jgi:hypothetical protein
VEGPDHEQVDEADEGVGAALDTMGTSITMRLTTVAIMAMRADAASRRHASASRAGIPLAGHRDLRAGLDRHQHDPAGAEHHRPFGQFRSFTRTGGGGTFQAMSWGLSRGARAGTGDGQRSISRRSPGMRPFRQV